MTKMIPEHLKNKIPRSERLIFQQIRDAPGSDEFVCFHSMGLARHERKEYAEADFIIVGPIGIYCLEVKGGKVVRNDEGWTIGWPGKSYFSIEGPFRQSEGTRWPLIKFLSENFGIKLRKETIVGWGVVFPDVIFNQESPEWDRDVVFDQRDLDQPFVSYIFRLEAYFRQRLAETGQRMPSKLGPRRVEEIVNLLRGDFDVVPSMAGLLLESKRELLQLSPDQYKVLDFALHKDNSRIVCDGAAGTGKTIIALEAARRLAAEGNKVLLLCFNRQLCRTLNVDTDDAHGAIHVSTVFKFFSEFIRRGANGQQLTEARQSSTSVELFEKHIPNLFEDAATILLDEDDLPQYDVLIIDEAQDILNGRILDCLDVILSNGFSNGKWLMFLDSKVQSELYSQLDTKLLDNLLSFGAASFLLSENFRNPKSIISEMCTLTLLEPPICKREVDSNVDYRTFRDEKDQGKKLRALLLELLKEGVSPEEITILSGRSPKESTAYVYPPDIGQKIAFLDEELGQIEINQITAASIAAFKGLENEIIIITDVPKLSPQSTWSNSVYYVGMTRARTKLFVLVNEEFLNARSKL